VMLPRTRRIPPGRFRSGVPDHGTRLPGYPIPGRRDPGRGHTVDALMSAVLFDFGRTLDADGLPRKAR